MTTTKRGNWLERNWKWFVPAVCLGLIAVIIAFIVGIVMLIVGAMRQSEVYQTATAAAQQNPQVIQALGTPIEPGLFFSGQINISGPSGNADISIPISGTTATTSMFCRIKICTSSTCWELHFIKINGIQTGMTFLMIPI